MSQQNEGQPLAEATPESRIAAYAMPDRGRILVIDDDAALRAAVRIVLGDVGFDVLEAENGADGVALAAASKPDLVITDWEMPVMDGYETIRRIRSEGATATLPVVMLTSRSHSNDIVRALAAGAQDFVIKPFKREEFLARIEQQLRWRRLLASDVAAGSNDGQPALADDAADAPRDTRPVQAALERGDFAGALELAIAEAERAEAGRDFQSAAGLYRGGSSAASRMGNPDLANKLLRLAGKMYLLWAESAQEDGKAIEDAYALAARMFMAAGNLKMARTAIEHGAEGTGF